MSYTIKLVRGEQEINLAHVHCGYVNCFGAVGACITFNDRLVRIHQNLNNLWLRLIDMTTNGWHITGDYNHPDGFTAEEFIKHVKSFGADPRDFAWYEGRMTVGTDGTHWMDLTGTV